MRINLKKTAIGTAIASAVVAGGHRPGKPDGAGRPH